MMSRVSRQRLVLFVGLGHIAALTTILLTWHLQGLHSNCHQQRPAQTSSRPLSTSSSRRVVHAALLPLQVNAPWRHEEFQCLAWQPVDPISRKPIQPRRPCWQRIRGGEAGYCEVRNRSSGALVQVMHTTPLSLKEEVRYTCRFAQVFADFRALAPAYRHDPPRSRTGTSHGPGNSQMYHQNGIAMAVHRGTLASAFASIRLLRLVGCQLPVELWYLQHELDDEDSVLRVLQQRYGPISLRQVYDSRIQGFHVKLHALYYSSFQNVLLMDADNFAIEDPTSLFFSTIFQQYGAVFWPDFWYPANMIFNIHAQSLLWEALGLEFRDMMEQESGQVLVDREKAGAALDLLMFYATFEPHVLHKLKLVWGDKDLFRLAWMKTQKAFYFNDHRLPGALGVVNTIRDRFCGLSMVQYYPATDRILFLHRNTVKLSGKRFADDERIWTMLQEYSRRSQRESVSSMTQQLVAQVKSYPGAKLFNQSSCFGVKRYQNHEAVHMTPLPPHHHILWIEDQIIHFAREGFYLMNGSLPLRL